MALWLFCGVQTNAENKSRMDARTDEKGSRTRKSPAFLSARRPSASLAEQDSTDEPCPFPKHGALGVQLETRDNCHWRHIK